MTPCDETLHAAAAIVQGLAKDAPPPFHARNNNNHNSNKPSTTHSSTSTPTSASTANGYDVPKVNLPGEDCEGKAALEKELAALISRVGNMQSFVVSRRPGLLSDSSLFFFFSFCIVNKPITFNFCSPLHAALPPVFRVSLSR